MINEPSKVTEYRINLNKPVVFPCTNNKHTEKEIMNSIPSTIASKKLKYLSVNLIKEVMGFYNENIKHVLKTLEKGTRKWEDIQCS